MEAETEFHALIKCPHAAALRWAMRDHWTLPDEEQLRTDEKDWLLLLISTLGREGASRMALLLWRTWHTRKEIVHNSKFNSLASSVGFLKSYDQLLLTSRVQEQDVNSKRPIQQTPTPGKKQDRVAHRWKAPLRGWSKANADGAFSTESGTGGIGVVIRDH